MATTWNPADKASAITLSNGNLTATSVGTAQQLVRSTTARTTGKYYFEVTLTTVATNVAVGIATSGESTAPAAGLGGGSTGATSLGFYVVSPTQATYINGVLLNGGTTASVNGEVLSFAVNLTGALIYIEDTVTIAAGGSWNNSTTDNPSTSTGGASLSTLNAGPYFIAFNDSTGGAVAVLNTGNQPFIRTIPTGYVAWDAATGAEGWGQAPAAPYRAKTEMVPY